MVISRSPAFPFMLCCHQVPHGYRGAKRSFVQWDISPILLLNEGSILWLIHHPSYSLTLCLCTFSFSSLFKTNQVNQLERVHSFLWIDTCRPCWQIEKHKAPVDSFCAFPKKALEIHLNPSSKFIIIKKCFFFPLWKNLFCSADLSFKTLYNKGESISNYSLGYQILLTAFVSRL